MERFIRRYGKYLIAFAMFITTFSVNSTCPFAAYQPELPNESDKLKKYN